MNRRIRVLCVDDNDINREVVQQLLGDECELRMAESGEEALATMRQWLPEVVLLDIMMPGVDGYETCRRIRAAAELRECKVILVSAKAMTSERLRGYEVGADDYVTKPFHAGELQAKVRVFGRLHSVEVLDRMKGDLLSILAHELRTPLTGILPAGEILSGLEPVTDEQRRMWGDIVLQNGRRLLDLVERGLLLCALQGGQRPIRRATVDLSARLASVVSRAVGLAALRDCRLVAEPAPPFKMNTDGELFAAAVAGMVDAALMLAGTGAVATVALTPTAAGARIQVVVRGACSAVGFEDALAGLGVRQAGGEIVGADIGLALARTIGTELGGEVTAARHDDGLQFAMTLATIVVAAPPTV